MVEMMHIKHKPHAYETIGCRLNRFCVDKWIFFPHILVMEHRITLLIPEQPMIYFINSNKIFKGPKSSISKGSIGIY